MYHIEYAVENSSTYYYVNSNHMPQKGDDITIEGMHYRIDDIQHILNHDAHHTLEEKFVVTIIRNQTGFSESTN